VERAVATLASVGTTHPWNVAGIGLDARVAAAFGLRHFMAVAAVTAQDAHGVRAQLAVPPDVLRAQLSVLRGADAYRIGALPTPEAVEAVVEHLASVPGVPAVVDPAFSATLGGALSSDAAIEAFRERMCALPVILTPNVPEAERLAGEPVADLAGMQRAARALLERGAAAVLLKGGHLDGATVVDVLLTPQFARTLSAPRLRGEMRGTGCVLAAVLACELARGRSLDVAVETARDYVRDRIAAGG